MNTSYILLHYNTHTQLILQYRITSLLLTLLFTSVLLLKCISSVSLMDTIPDVWSHRCGQVFVWKFGSLLKLFTTIKRSVLFIWCHFLFFILCSLPPFLCWTFKDIIINMLHYIQADARGQQHKAGGKLLICGFLALHDLPT